jgi:hypothetical protein
VTRPRNKDSIRFPFTFESNGRTGRIKRWGKGKFGTYFLFAGKKHRNSFGSFDSAYEYLEREFSKLDTDQANSLALYPLKGNVQTYSELEDLVSREGDGATLREAVAFFLANRKRIKFHPRDFSDCSKAFIQHQRANNISPIQIRTLEKHFRRFEGDFGTSKIHEITTLEIGEWLASRTDVANGMLWSAKTRISVLGSLVSLSIFARDVLQAIPDHGKTEFQKVRRPKKDERTEVEIYTPEEMLTLLVTALETDIDLIPAIVIGGFQGLRPAEFHGEGTRRRPLTWEAFIWNDNILHVTGQKVRSKADRDIPLHTVTEAWLKPFRDLSASPPEVHAGGVGDLGKSISHRWLSSPMKKRDTNLPTQRKALKITETADTLGVNPASIRRAIQRGMLRPCRAFRHVLISVEEIERFLRENS